MGIFDGLVQTREHNIRVQRLKFTLLQRFTMKQLQEVYKDYLYTPPQAPKESQEQNESLLGIAQSISASASAGMPSSRMKLIDSIIAQMSLEQIKECAKKYAVKEEDITL